MMTHVMNFLASFEVVKQEHVEGDTGCVGFQHLFIGFIDPFKSIFSFGEKSQSI